MQAQRDSLERFVTNLKSKIPSDGASIRKIIDPEAPAEPWEHRVVDGITVCYLPSNMETFADSMLAIAYVAAAAVLDARFEVTQKVGELKVLDKKQKAYVSGLAWGLSRKTLGECQASSGPMSHGYYHVAHLALHKKIGSAWWAKGTPWSITMGLTGKAWDSSMSLQAKFTASLVNTAAEALDVTRTWHTWVRSKESFFGKEIRKSTGLEHDCLTSGEKEYLSSIFQIEIQAYNDVRAIIDEPTLQNITKLDKELQKVGTGLKKLDSVVEKILNNRMPKLFPKSGKKSKVKITLQERIKQLDFMQYMGAYDPLIMKDKPLFRIEPRAEGFDQPALDVLKGQYIARLNSYIKEDQEESFYKLCRDFATEVFAITEED